MLHRQPKATNAGSEKVKDPVCAMTVNPAKSAATVELAGTTYYFCSAYCAKTFTADPAHYLAISG